MNSRIVHYRYIWHDVWSSLHSLNRKAELLRLIRWAKRKRLAGPLNLYLTRYQQEEAVLIRMRSRSPRALAFARFMHCISNIFSPAPNYYPRGAAKHYRQRRSKRTVVNN